MYVFIAHHLTQTDTPPQSFRDPSISPPPPLSAQLNLPIARFLVNHHHDDHHPSQLPEDAG